MRTRAALGSIFASIAVLIVGWQAGSAAAAHSEASATTSTSTGGTGTTGTGSSTSGGTTSGGSTSSGTSGSSTSGSSTSGSSSASGTAKDGTFTGASEQTRFGDVQVKVTISGGKITDVQAVHLTDQDGRSVEISNYAAPILRNEVLSAQSANVDSVGGATYTSDGYLTSLQSALDQAGFTG